MRTKFGFLATALLTAAALETTPAHATTFDLNYTTFNDGLNAPVMVRAVLTAAADPFDSNGYIVQSITGMRGAQAITSLSDPFSEFYFPATVLPGYQFATFLDSFGITFAAGGTDYQIYRGPGDSSFYHESQNPDGISVGRLIQPASFSVTPAAASVPEPATWAMTLFGVGMLGWAMRRQGAWRQTRIRTGIRLA